MYAPVVVEASRSARGYDAHLVFCSIECARHSGYEPTRIAFPPEADQPCAGCGFDPVQYLEDSQEDVL